MLDILIKNGTLIDGTGAPARTGSIGILNGKLVSDPADDAPAKETVDAAGRIVCPGFIDAHSHGDLILGTEDARLFKTAMGVTTECMGQCGLSMVPAVPENLTASQNMLKMGTTFFPDDMKNWSSWPRYLDYADRQKLTCNGKLYIGHSNLRIAVMGMADRPATDRELDRMKGILREAMEEGCAGFSTGLIYTPSCYAEEKEIIELAKVIEPFDGIYASHMRNEGEFIEKSVEETIRVGRMAGVRVDISHHKMVGRAYWGKQKNTLAQVHRANEEGIRVFLDQYPYERCMTTLNVCMPPWYFSEGFASMAGKLRDKAFRAQVRKEMQDPATPYDNYFLNSGGFDGIFVYLAAKTPEAEGRTLSEYAALVGKDPFEAFFDLCVENNCETGGVYAAMSDEDVCEIIRDPYCIVGSDGLTRAWNEKGHPRASGTFPHVITHFVQEKKILTMEEAIRKMTGLSADLLLIRNKGYLKKGFDADVLILDPVSFRDTATYMVPNSKADGIDAVYVAGELVYRGKEFTGRYPGRLLRHNS